MVLPTPGTPAYNEWMRKARNPNSVEASVMRQMTDKTVDDQQQKVRSMLQTMIEVVPGQMFRDVSRFHAKFGLEPTNDDWHRLPDDVLHFRIKFMIEELEEYMSALGLDWAGDAYDVRRVSGTFVPEKAFDALIDLAYVCLGTAYLHRFPFNEGWERVQEKNMAKERAIGADDERSTRKHSIDVVKPAGWTPPVLSDLLGPYADVYKLLKNYEQARVVLIVADPALVQGLQGEFDQLYGTRCVVGTADELRLCRPVDVVISKVVLTLPFIDASLRPYMNKGGRIVMPQEVTLDAEEGNNTLS